MTTCIKMDSSPLKVCLDLVHILFDLDGIFGSDVDLYRTMPCLISRSKPKMVTCEPQWMFGQTHDEVSGLGINADFLSRTCGCVSLEPGKVLNCIMSP